MIKAKNFWNYLCNELGYRFFAGNPCLGFKKLYDSMNSEIMHYIPAVNSNSAVGMVSGAALSGHKSAILLDTDNLYKATPIITKFNMAYKIPFLIIVYVNGTDVKSIPKIPSISISKDYKKELDYIDKKSTRTGIPGIVFIGEGVL